MSHFAISSAPDTSPPAGSVLSLRNGATGRTVSLTSAWGVATLPARPAAEWRTSLCGHAERLEDAGADEVLPALARDRLDHLSRHQVQHVVVGVRVRNEVAGRMYRSRRAISLRS